MLAQKSELPADIINSPNMPKKAVKNVDDVAVWQRSEAYFNVMGFINCVSSAIQGKRISSDMHVSESMKKLLQIISHFNDLVDQTPPANQPQRFGNMAYRTWNSKMIEVAYNLLKDALPEDKHNYVTELGVYLTGAFGSAMRIDYGTGHELSFIFFICALFKAEVLLEQDYVASALKLFNEYLKLVRRLQTTYRMEPAGSQGVWALDDYQFVPFIWGSAQLALNSPFPPVKFLEADIINEWKDEYIFIGCIDYISKVKTGLFAEHSNQLWSISSVQSWSKIYAGLVRMFQKEILSKFPIVQHIYFGQLMPYKAAPLGTQVPTPSLGFAVPANRKHNLEAKPMTNTSVDSGATSLNSSMLNKLEAAVSEESGKE